MTKHRDPKKPLWTIASLVLAVSSPLLAGLIYVVSFPSADVGPEGNEHVAIAILAVVAFTNAAIAWLGLSLLGVVAGAVGLLRRETRRTMRLVATTWNASVLLAAVAWLAANR